MFDEPALLNSVVSPPKPSGRVTARVLERRVVGDVDGVGDAVDLLGDRCCLVCVDVDDGDCGAFGCHPPARRGTDPGSTTGHERLATVEQAHPAMMAATCGRRRSAGCSLARCGSR